MSTFVKHSIRYSHISAQYNFFFIEKITHIFNSGIGSQRKMTDSILTSSSSLYDNVEIKTK